MKTVKRLIALILTFAIVFSVMMPSASASTEVPPEVTEEVTTEVSPENSEEPSTEIPSDVETEDENNPKNFDDYMEILKDGGYPSLSTRTYLKITKFFNTIFRFITGRGFIKRESFNFTADALVVGLSKKHH